MLKDFDIEGKVRCVTNDSGSEMGPALTMVREKLNAANSSQLQEDWHIGCARFIVNNTVRSCMSTLSKQLENLRDTIKSIRMSQKAACKVEEITSSTWFKHMQGSSLLGCRYSLEFEVYDGAELVLFARCFRICN